MLRSNRWIWCPAVWLLVERVRGGLTKGAQLSRLGLNMVDTKRWNGNIHMIGASISILALTLKQEDRLPKMFQQTMQVPKSGQSPNDRSWNDFIIFKVSIFDVCCWSESLLSVAISGFVTITAKPGFNFQLAWTASPKMSNLTLRSLWKANVEHH